MIVSPAYGVNGKEASIRTHYFLIRFQLSLIKTEAFQKGAEKSVRDTLSIQSAFSVVLVISENVAQRIHFHTKTHKYGDKKQTGN